ncbi:hypothetical protein A1O7_03052 [Cladophialophora yegresii CBS 114405]|uniref:Cyanovirin-N domain-containing protein n=1 Tax=Cladophialophora yegresii CBS 114405 TaxID=1182544 RepID=W9WWD6_9EURO|nr:uncharacterized protein A1O7_03052 [Cladophialophora yegresii CBS 114405]EXJ62614.1 hypothetical protein A1O7_03052 [Cladophialophora yegresii CBS 114405]
MKIPTTLFAALCTATFSAIANATIVARLGFIHGRPQPRCAQKDVTLYIDVDTNMVNRTIDILDPDGRSFGTVALEYLVPGCELLLCSQASSCDSDSAVHFYSPVCSVTYSDGVYWARYAVLCDGSEPMELELELEE